MQEITIVGAGLSGLIAAIQLAEQGARVVLHEAGAKPGGRARTDSSLRRVNLGPHAIYRRGAFGRWLTENDLLPPVHFPSLMGLRILKDKRTRRMVAGLPQVMRSGNRPAPIDESYRSWATREFDADFARLAIGFASLPTYHPDPGILSAAFVQERIARSSQWRPVWYINGGWINLVDRLAIHAEKLGVEIVTRSKLSRLPDGPCIVATDLAAAAKLLGEPELDWPSPDNALLDVALEKRWGDPTAVLDVDDHAYISCYSAGDASVAPRGESLLQGVTGIHPGEEPEAARERVYA
ncbi:MAG: FAD-dependent oxidoreductase, partial [Deltaproteobacteria bacterium]|nr:FAD-dependent oxidoreductase [Deltaproteobacteria bacterium]